MSKIGGGGASGVESKLSVLFCTWIKKQFNEKRPVVIGGHPRVILDHPGVVLGYPGVILGHPLVVLGHPGVVLGHPGVVLGHPGVILGYFRGTKVSEREIERARTNFRNLRTE